MPNISFDFRAADLLKSLANSRQLERFHRVTGPMGPTTHVEGPNGDVSNHPEVTAAGIDGLKKYEAGTASVRFICGTLDCNREIEQTSAAAFEDHHIQQTLAAFSKKTAANSFQSCINAFGSGV